MKTPLWNPPCNEVGMSQRIKTQTCKVCQRQDYFEYRVPDEIWGVIVPGPLLFSSVCLSCFHRFAAKRNVDYKPWLQLRYFQREQDELDPESFGLMGTLIN